MEVEQAILVVEHKIVAILGQQMTIVVSEIILVKATTPLRT